MSSVWKEELSPGQLTLGGHTLDRPSSVLALNSSQFRGNNATQACCLLESWRKNISMVLLIQASPTIPLMIIIIYSKRKPNKLTSKFLKNVSLVPLCLSRLDELRLFCFRHSGTVAPNLRWPHSTKKRLCPKRDFVMQLLTWSTEPSHIFRR